jgi:ABC-2 type transport system ATP-binding protein
MECFLGSPNVLSASCLKKSFGENEAVRDLSFEISAGEICGLLGPNGAGKSTTQMILAGYLPADNGTVSINGTAVSTSSKLYRSQLGVVPQELAIYPELSARENLHFFGKLYGLSGNDLLGQIDVVLQTIGLESRADEPAAQFSGGMKRRLNFGIGILHRPRFLILDEPTVGVDPQSRAFLLESIQQQAADGVGVLYASHYMEEVEVICQKALVIDHGQLIAQGTISGLLNRVPAELAIVVESKSENFQQLIPDRFTVKTLSDNNYNIRLSAQENQIIDLTAELAELIQLIQADDAKLISVNTEHANLEQLFLNLTGRTLRD